MAYDLAQKLNLDECFVLADALGDTPQTAIAVGRLLEGVCDAWTVGPPERFSAALVQTRGAPREPMAFGKDAQAIWLALREASGWVCVSTDLPDVGRELGELMQRDLSRPMRYCGDWYYALKHPAKLLTHAAVRLMTSDDANLLANAPRELRGGESVVLNLLKRGPIACAIVDDRIIATVHTNSITPHHADIGAFGMQEFRNQGLITAAASLVADELQKLGRTPVWSTGEDNLASQRVAIKLGFEQVARGVYVIPS